MPHRSASWPPTDRSRSAGADRLRANDGHRRRAARLHWADPGLRVHAASWDYRWAVGNALAAVADDAVLDDVVELSRDHSDGRDRQMLVLALARMKDPRVVGVLTELLDDDEVVGHAVMALGRLKATEAWPAIERCLEHPQGWVREEARKALAHLGE